MKIRYIILISLVLVLIAGCSDSAEDAATGSSIDSMSSTDRAINIDKLEIYHFHGTNQCYSCKTVGAYAEETVNTYFKDELENGIILFDHINGDLPENKDMVMKYQVTGSSLWLGTYNEGDFNAEQNTNVWYKISNKQDYMSYLKGVIEQKLAGN